MQTLAIEEVASIPDAHTIIFGDGYTVCRTIFDRGQWPNSPAGELVAAIAGDQPDGWGDWRTCECDFCDSVRAHIGINEPLFTCCRAEERADTRF